MGPLVPAVVEAVRESMGAPLLVVRVAGTDVEADLPYDWSWFVAASLMMDDG